MESERNDTMLCIYKQCCQSSGLQVMPHEQGDDADRAETHTVPSTNTYSTHKIPSCFMERNELN